MAVVSTPPSMSSVVSVFGGPGNLTAYYRGGPYVPNIPQNAAISTSPGSLALSQFAGATNYVPVSASVSPTSVSNSTSQTIAGNTNIETGPVTVTPSGGSGTYTFNWVKLSGNGTVANTSHSSNNTCNPALFEVTLHVGGPGTSNTDVSVYRCVVSDGTTSANTANVTATSEVINNA